MTRTADSRPTYSIARTVGGSCSQVETKTFLVGRLYVDVVSTWGDMVDWNRYPVAQARGVYGDAVARGFAKAPTLDARVTLRATDALVSVNVGGTLRLNSYSRAEAGQIFSAARAA